MGLAVSSVETGARKLSIRHLTYLYPMFHRENTMKRVAKHNAGLTLIESLMAMSLLAISITAVTMPFTAAAMAEMEDARRTIAAALAREMMEEVLALPFYDPDGPSVQGPEVSEVARADFDNIDDYHGYTEADGNINSADGEVMSDPACQGLSRSVTVEYGYVDGQDVGETPTFVQISVVVQYEGSDVVSIVRLVYARDSIVDDNDLPDVP